MSDFLTLNAHGDPQLTMPPSQLFQARWVAPDTYLVGWGHLRATVDRLDVIHMHAVLTQALDEGPDRDQITTPETLARQGGVA